MRTGIIAKKIGMTRLYLVDGTHVPVTVLSLQDCQVVANQTVEKNGYFSVTIGTSNKEKIKNVSKAQKESYSKLKITPKQNDPPTKDCWCFLMGDIFRSERHICSLFRLFLGGRCAAPILERKLYQKRGSRNQENVTLSL